MIVLTVGKSFVDIDGYASCLAYRELLKMQGIESRFVTHAVLNYSITKSLLDLPYRVDNYEINTNDQFIILDLSNKEFFPDFVSEDLVVELIDHHPGFENYWNDKLGNKSIIESIGSVATIIVEKYEQSNLLEKMDKFIAKLLMAAILDNTLNFTAKITGDRDIKAYNKLQTITGELDFADNYFNECQKTIESNLDESIVNDLKHQKINEYLPETIGQLTIWDVDKLKDKKDRIKQIMNNNGNKWIINIISLKKNISYIMYSDDGVRQNISELFDCKDNGEFLILKPARLRKEIIKVALQKKEKKMNQYTNKEQAIIKQCNEGPFHTLITKINVDEFNDLVTKLIIDDDSNVLTNLIAIYYDYNRNKIIDYFIDKGDVELLLGFLDYCNDFDAPTNQLDQKYVVNKLLEKSDKKLIENLLNSNFIFFLTDMNERERLIEYISN